MFFGGFLHGGSKSWGACYVPDRFALLTGWHLRNGWELRSVAGKRRVGGLLQLRSFAPPDRRGVCPHVACIGISYFAHRSVRVTRDAIRYRFVLLPGKDRRPNPENRIQHHLFTSTTATLFTPLQAR